MLEHAIYTPGFGAESERDSAQHLLNRLQCAINQRNWPLFQACFSDDVVIVNLLGQRLSGPEELARYQQQLITMHQDRIWVYKLLYLQQLDLDTFLLNVEQQWQHQGQHHKVGLCSTPLYVLRRQGRQWQICAGNTL